MITILNRYEILHKKTLDRYLSWDASTFRKELMKAKSDMEASHSGFTSHAEEIARTKRQSQAAYKYSEMMQVLRYMAEERDDLPTPMANERDRIDW
jgi:hypothetical protein